MPRLRRADCSGPGIRRTRRGRGFSYVDDAGARIDDRGVTALAAVALGVSGRAAATPTARKRAENRAVQEVAGYLGNTPAVCRKSYIDPRVFDAFRAGLTIRPALERVAARLQPGELPIHQPALEAAVLDLLNERADSPAVEQVAA